MKRFLGVILALALGQPAPGASDYLKDLPAGDRWIAHLNGDLLPFWSTPSGLGTPLGVFPSTRCDDGALLDFKKPCAPIAGNAYLMTPARYLVPQSRQTFGYGVAYHLTGDPKYLTWMKAGIEEIRAHLIDPAGGMFTTEDLTQNTWGPQLEFRDPQQLGYGLLSLAFYYYLTRDDQVLQNLTAIKTFILDHYYNPSLGTMQWLLKSNGGQRFDEKHLVADLDQMNTYLVLLAPILPEPYQAEWKQSLTLLSHSMLGTFYSPGDNLLFTQADTPQQVDLAATGVDFGHTSKGLWMMRFTGLMTGDQGLASFATAAARQHLDRAFLPEDGSWAGGVLAGGATDKNKNWWVYAELDQLSNTLALSDLSAGQYLPQTAAYWFQYFVDHQSGEVWNGVNYGTNTPQRDYPKAWQWKSAYHDFEHVLVGYIGAQWLHGQPATLHYAFQGAVDQSTIHPYYFSAVVDSVVTTTDGAGNQYQTVSFGPPDIPAPSVVSSVSTASFLAAPLAAGSMATAFGSRLADATAQAQSTPLPLVLGAASVALQDSSGASLAAPLFYVSPAQINFLVPATAKPGPATFKITSGDGSETLFHAQIAGVSPGMFQLNLKSALCAASVVRVQPGKQTLEAVYQLDALNNVVARPVDLGPATDQVYLSIYGTGIQNAKTVSVTVGGLDVEVLYTGPQGSTPGLDQVNVGPLPRSLAGRGRVNIVLAADGQTANPVVVAIK